MTEAAIEAFAAAANAPHADPGRAEGSRCEGPCPPCDLEAALAEGRIPDELIELGPGS